MYCYTLTPRQGLDLSSQSHDIHLPLCDMCALNHLFLDKPDACLGNIHSFLSLRFRLDIKKITPFLPVVCRQSLAVPILLDSLSLSNASYMLAFGC